MFVARSHSWCSTTQTLHHVTCVWDIVKLLRLHSSGYLLKRLNLAEPFLYQNESWTLNMREQAIKNHTTILMVTDFRFL